MIVRALGHAPLSHPTHSRQFPLKFKLRHYLAYTWDIQLPQGFHKRDSLGLLILVPPEPSCAGHGQLRAGGMKVSACSIRVSYRVYSV